MFDSLEHEIKRHNELLQQILDKGGLGVVLEGLEPVMPSRGNVNTYPYDYDRMKRQVFWRIGERVSNIVKLHAEIKYLCQFIDNCYKSVKELEELGGKVGLREDIKDFIEKYEEEHGKTNQ